MIRVHVHPGARHEGLRGWRADGALRLEVTAPPEGGRANLAVAELLAGALGVARGRVAVVRGQGSRSKLVAVEGIEEPELRQRIERALAGRGAAGGE
jgi:uncharacterized protein YggU (UPF0235/DUF167 family)